MALPSRGHQQRRLWTPQHWTCHPLPPWSRRFPHQKHVAQSYLVRQLYLMAPGHRKECQQALSPNQRKIRKSTCGGSNKVPSPQNEPTKQLLPLEKATAHTWSALNSALASKPDMYGIWLSKQASSWCMKRKNMVLLQDGLDDKCPNCQRASYLAAGTLIPLEWNKTGHGNGKMCVIMLFCNSAPLATDTCPPNTAPIFEIAHCACNIFDVHMRQYGLSYIEM